MSIALDGYSFAEWPNLSGDRAPKSCSNVASKAIPAEGDEQSIHESINTSVILLAVARVISAYCGVTDVLLAVQINQHGKMNFIRISWNEEDTWAELKSRVDQAIRDALGQPLSLDSIRKTLALDEKQYPYLALCAFDRCDQPQDARHPPIISYSNLDSIIHLSASSSLLHPTVSTQFISQVVELVSQGSKSPSSKFSHADSLSSELMSAFERGSNDEVDAAYPHVSSVEFAPDYLAERVEDMPNETAVRWYPELSLEDEDLEYESISYLDFDKKSNQVARWLLRLGLQPEDRVAVCLDRNLHFHVAMMGIMKAGGCYVPIDPELPLERKTYIAQDASAAFVLTSADISSWDVFGDRTVYIEDEESQNEIIRQSSESVNLMDPNGLAYMLYTSGTTGNPKGCLLTHHGLAQAILALSSTASDVRMNSIHDGRYLAVASIAFDVHLAETIVPIALGMPLLSARRSQLLENLPVYVKRLGVTHLGIVPSLIEATLNAAQGGDPGSDIGLRYIASGGEKMSDSILDKWADHPQVRLANFYGPSEVTIGCCARYMTSNTLKGNIGKPFANVSGYVVDANMNILLRGGVGELVVEGPLVGRGYHGRPDLTAKVFLEWPRKGCWAYRTGDLVRMMPDSTIEILGRIDTQIKLRGVRIESEGISAIVRKAVPPTSTFTVDATTVLAKHPAINVDQLVSFFTWDGSVPILTRKSRKPHITTPPPNFVPQIKETCEAELPSYMRPSHFIPLSWLPLSSNGKTDSKILIELFKNLSVEEITELSTSHETSRKSRPCSDVELKVLKVLQNHVALMFEEAHPDINIFECGLDSMGVIKFASELKDVFQTKVVAARVMKAPRIADIASYLIKETTTLQDLTNLCFDIPALDEIYSIYRNTRIDDVLPPFPVQEGVLSRSADVDTLYVQHVMVSCKHDVSLSLLQAAWQSVVDENQILRTVFHFGRTLSQVVLKPSACGLNWTQKELGEEQDGQNFPVFFMSNEASAISKTINQNISATPPYQLSAYLSAKNTYLVLSIQHALFDGISLPHIFHQVEREYLGLQRRDQASFSGILGHINAIDLDLAKAFWENYLRGYCWPQHSLYSDSLGPTQRLKLPFKASLASIKEMATLKSVTMQALFTCAFAHCLALKVYKQKDVVFGVIRSGRLLPIDHIDESLSPLVTVLPVRINFETPQVSLQEIQEGISSMIEYEHLPLGKVQQWVRPGKSVFDVLFSVSVSNRSESKLWHVIESEPPQADYPLAVEIVISPSSNSVELNAAWMDQSGIESPELWLRGFEDVVSSLANDTSAYISRSLDGLAHRSSAKSRSDPSQKQSFPDRVVDTVLLDVLRTAIASFMGFKPEILTPAISFISLGLDSIKSVGLSKAISKAGYHVTSTDILRNATLNELAVLIQTKKSVAGDPIAHRSQSTLDINPAILSEITPESVRLSVDEEVQFFPTTALQTGMLSQTVNSKGGLYVHAFPLRLPGNIEIERLHAAWVKAVQCFAILRTSFHFSTEFGVWIQAIHSCAHLDWSVVSLPSVDDYRSELGRLMSSIDLSDETRFRRPPLWVRLFSCTTEGSEEPVSFLVFAMHHCLYDGMSIGKLVHSVQTLYAGGPIPRVHQFHELLPHFLQQEKEGTSFWVNRLRSLKPRKLPRLRQTSLDSPSETLERTFFLDASTIRETLSKASVTMQCLCQAAWARVLSKYMGSSDVVFGHTVSGRSISGAEDVIGPVLNSIPCCIRVEIGMKNIDLLRTIHQSNLESLAWQQASPRAIQKAMGVESIWDSLFLFQTSEMDGSSVNSWTFDTDANVDEAKVQYPLNVEISYHGSSITMKCASHPDFINSAELDKITEDFQQFLQQILYEPFAMITGRFLAPSKAEVLPIPVQTVPKASNKNPAISDTTAPTIRNTLNSFAYEPILMAITNAPVSLMKPETPLVALGVDSIMAIQIVGKFRQSGMKIVASDILSSKTIGDMLEKVSVMKNASKPKQTIELIITDAEKRDIYGQFMDNAKEIESVCVMSSGMKWLIGAWQKSLGTRYQHVFAYQLPHDVDIPEMKGAWLSLIQRHPILRSTFALPTGRDEPRLVTFKSLDNSWAEESVDDDVFFRSILSRMKSMVSNPPSTALPPSRGLLFHSTNKSFLIIHLHHFQYDAWSLQLLMHDLSQLYRGLDPGASISMQGFLDHYSTNPEHLSQQEKYWRTHFPIDFKPILFPQFNSHTNINQSARRFIRTNAACIADASRCEERARLLGVSLQCVLLACWAVLQGKITGSASSTFGLWHSGRTGAVDDVANLSAPCINVLPFHVPEVDEKSILQVAKRIQTNLLKRTAVIEQTDQVRVNEWVGLPGQPMCNVFVNIIKVAPDTGERDPILEPVIAPYYVPEIVEQDKALLEQYGITKILNDEIFIDIATLTNTDCIMMSIDAAPWMLDEKQADVLMNRWGHSVKECLFLV